MAPTSASRRRPALVLTSALGAVVGLLGAAGVFATSADRATTGQNDARSGDLAPPAVHLQLARREVSTCQPTWSDDLSTGVLVSDGQVMQWDDGSLSDTGSVCVRNVGTEAATVSLRAIDVVETEVGCTPGEAEAGDSTCGGTGSGELSQVLDIYGYVRCAQHQTATMALAYLAAGRPMPILTLEPGEQTELCLWDTWDHYQPPRAEDLRSQTDRVSWRFELEGTSEHCADAPEGDDSLFTARVFGDSGVDGQLCTGDSDWFTFDGLGIPGHPVVVTATGTGDAAAAVELRLYDQTGAYRGGGATSANGPATAFVPVSGPYVSGPFYVEVYGYHGSTGGYHLAVSRS